jgi:hypothetical protein
MSRQHRSLPLGVLVWGLVGLAGCGGGPTKHLGPIVPVKGKVYLGEKPLMGGTISFLSLDEADMGAPVSTGTIDEQGGYSIKTGNKTGAPVGKWRVTVDTAGADKSPGGQESQFDPVYGNWKNSPLTVEVKENAPAGAYDFHLKTRKR